MLARCHRDALDDHGAGCFAFQPPDAGRKDFDFHRRVLEGKELEPDRESKAVEFGRTEVRHGRCVEGEAEGLAIQRDVATEIACRQALKTARSAILRSHDFPSWNLK